MVVILSLSRLQFEVAYSYSSCLWSSRLHPFLRSNLAATRFPRTRRVMTAGKLFRGSMRKLELWIFTNLNLKQLRPLPFNQGHCELWPRSRLPALASS
jgi:hypothetical protein